MLLQTFCRGASPLSRRSEAPASGAIGANSQPGGMWHRPAGSGATGARAPRPTSTVVGLASMQVGLITSVSDVK